MGRPVTQCMGEVRGLVQRAEYMLSIAQDALADVVMPEPESEKETPGFKRFIRRVPMGVVLVVAPWK
jgi:acyl-CoA reductase-like NAD-dependent aldehyde dehydrogenase